MFREAGEPVMMSRVTRSPWWQPERARFLASAILEDLTVDTALTVGQVRRRYGAPRDLVRKVCKLLGEAVEYRTVGLRPAANAYREIRVEVMSLGRIRKVSRLPYLLGLAEMRTALSIPPDRWHIQAKTPWGLSPRSLPSVVATHSDGQLLAVEYDCGQYQRTHIVARHRTLASCWPRVVWGVPGLRRAISIARTLPDAEVWHVSWETGSHVLVQRDGQLLVTPETLADTPGTTSSTDRG
mgnify:FL=1